MSVAHQAMEPFEVAAYHEAGHAVAMYALDLRFSAVKVEARVNDGRLSFEGCTYHHRWPRPLSQEQGEKEIKVALAGAVAARDCEAWDRRYAIGNKSDLEEAAAVARHCSPDDIQGYLASLRRKTRRLLHKPEYVLAVRRLAEALMQYGSFGYHDARVIIEGAIKEAANTASH